MTRASDKRGDEEMRDWNYLKDNYHVIVKDSKTYVEVTEDVYRKLRGSLLKGSLTPEQEKKLLDAIDRHKDALVLLSEDD